MLVLLLVLVMVLRNYLQYLRATNANLYVRFDSS